MSVYTRSGELFVPTVHARGPWDPGAQHGGAPAALVARAIERLAPDMRLARVTLEFVGAVPLAPLAVHAEIVKPGRRFQIAEVRLSNDGRDVVWARASLIRSEPMDVPPSQHPAPLEPGPETALRNLYTPDTEGFGLTAVDLRFVDGDFGAPGPAKTWARLDMPLVEGEQPTPVQRALAAADFGNGISSVAHWDDWLFVNTELTVHLHREPEGEWVGIDAQTALEPNGSGLAVAVLHDRRGPIGRAAQALFIAPR